MCGYNIQYIFEGRSPRWGGECLKMKASVKTANCGDGNSCANNGVCYAATNMVSFSKGQTIAKIKKSRHNSCCCCFGWGCPGIVPMLLLLGIGQRQSVLRAGQSVRLQSVPERGCLHPSRARRRRNFQVSLFTRYTHEPTHTSDDVVPINQVLGPGPGQGSGRSGAGSGKFLCRSYFSLMIKSLESD